MAVTEHAVTESGDLQCTYHPNVATRLRCSRCGKPICPRCGVRTPVGLRCPDCAGVRGLPTYRTSASGLVRAVIGGLIVAVPVGVLWGYFPNWQFFLALLLGFATVEVMAKAVNFKRGRDLQLLAMGIIVMGMVVSRVVMAQRFGISLDEVNQLTEPYVSFFLQLRLIPDLIYACLPLLIAWIRFR